MVFVEMMMAYWVLAVFDGNSGWICSCQRLVLSWSRVRIANKSPIII